MLPLFSKPLQAVTCDDVHLLVSEGYPEGDTVEFKEKLPHKQGGDDPWYHDGDLSAYARNQLLEEIVAFANAYGGTLMVGIQETTTRPARAAGLVSIPRCEELAERLRLQIRDCVEPQIPMVHTWGVVTEAEGKGVIIIRVQQSRLAPHRHTPNRECFIRRADRSEKMTMREIQDLTLQRDRGLQAVDRVFQEHSQHFRQQMKETQKLTPYGLRVTAVPLETLYTEKVYGNISLFPHMRRNMALSFGAKKFAISAFSPEDERPILRGTRRTRTSDAGTIIQELHCDGVVEIILVVHSTEYENIPLGLILGTAANGLHMVEAFRQGIGTPVTEYALEIELVRFEGDVCLGSLQPRRPLDNYGIVRPNPCMFPRLSVGPLEAFGAVMRFITNDLLNAAGAPAMDEDGTLHLEDNFR